MYQVFWKSLFITFMAFILFTNIVFAFDLAQMINPAALEPGYLEPGTSYHDYYFGMSSFIDSFESFFAKEDTFLGRYNTFLMETANKFSAIFTKNGFVSSVVAISGSKNADNMIVAIVTIAMLLISGAPLILLVAYGVLWLGYLALFAIEVILFILSFMGGAFKTLLPSTDWYQYQGDWPWIPSSDEPPIYESIMALMV